MNQRQPQSNMPDDLTDPDVARVLKSISEVRHERDNLKLDLEQARRALSLADGKIAQLEQRLALMQAQRDHFMSKLIEAATHIASAKVTVDTAERAVMSCVDKGSINGQISDQAFVKLAGIVEAAGGAERQAEH